MQHKPCQKERSPRIAVYHLLCRQNQKAKIDAGRKLIQQLQQHCMFCSKDDRLAVAENGFVEKLLDEHYWSRQRFCQRIP
jgi:hypothetical protein